MKGNLHTEHRVLQRVRRRGEAKEAPTADRCSQLCGTTTHFGASIATWSCCGREEGLVVPLSYPVFAHCVCTLRLHCQFTGHVTRPSVCDVGSSDPHNCVHKYPPVALTPLSLFLKICLSLFTCLCVSLCVSLCLFSLNVPHNLLVRLSFLVCVFSLSLCSFLLVSPTSIICRRKAMLHVSEYLCGTWSCTACSTQESWHCFEEWVFQGFLGRGFHSSHAFISSPF